MEGTGRPDFLDTGVVLGHLVVRDAHAGPARECFQDASVKRFGSERVMAEAKRVLDRSRGVITGFLNDLEARAGSRVRRSADSARAIQRACEEHVLALSLDSREASQLRGFVRVRMDDLRNALLGQSDVLEQLRLQVALDLATAGDGLALFFDAVRGLAELFVPGPFASRDGWRAGLSRVVPNPCDIEILIDAGQIAAERGFGAIRFVTTDRTDIGNRASVIRGVVKALEVRCLN